MPLPQSINSCWFDSQSVWMGLHVVRVSARVFSGFLSQSNNMQDYCRSTGHSWLNSSFIVIVNGCFWCIYGPVMDSRPMTAWIGSQTRLWLSWGMIYPCYHIKPVCSSRSGKFEVLHILFFLCNKIF